MTYSTTDITTLRDYVKSIESSRTLKQLTQWDDRSADTIDDDKLDLACIEALARFDVQVGSAFTRTDKRHLLMARWMTMCALYESCGLLDEAEKYEKKLSGLIEPRKPAKRVAPYTTSVDVLSNQPTGEPPPWDESHWRGPRDFRT